MHLVTLLHCSASTKNLTLSASRAAQEKKLYFEWGQKVSFKVSWAKTVQKKTLICVSYNVPIQYILLDFINSHF